MSNTKIILTLEAPEGFTTPSHVRFTIISQDKREREILISVRSDLITLEPRILAIRGYIHADIHFPKEG